MTAKVSPIPGHYHQVAACVGDRWSMNAMEQFRDAVRSAGLSPPEVIEPDGKLRRFASNGKRGDEAGWYVFHGDGIPAGAFGDWRSGLDERWRADIGRDLTPAEEASHRRIIEAARAQRDADEAERRAEAREEAEKYLAESSPCTEHPYLIRKGIQPHGVRVHGGELLVPMRIDAELHSLQRICPDGTKRFLSGGRTKSCYHIIGDLEGTTALCIGEGFATAASIHECTGLPVATAFSANNLLPVAKAMRERFHDMPIIVCADDDSTTAGNPGITAATQAARAIGGLLAIPDGPGDFNDMHQRCGPEAVRDSVLIKTGVSGVTVVQPNNNTIPGVVDINNLRNSASSVTPDSAQPFLERVARADLSRSQQDDLLKLVKAASGVTLEALRADLLSELRKAGVVKDEESAATTLVKLAEEAGIELWHDLDKNPWATLRVEDHLEYHALKTRSVKRYLQGLYFEKTESSAHSEAIQSALGVLESKAVFKGKEHKVYVRVAEVGGAIYIDLCDELWRVVRVTSDGVSAISMVDCPVRFRRSKGVKPLQLPNGDYGDNGDEIPTGLPNTGFRYLPGLCALASLINVPTDSREWRLLVAWLLSLLRGRIPYPVLVLNGEQGSGKSTAARLLRSIVDPSTALLRSLPRERRDLFISATNSWVQCFDNVSGLADWLSDDLCRLSTGGGLATRELYSDQEETILDAQRPCVLNGITDFVVRQDLVDRAALVTLPSIPDLERRPEAAILLAFNAIQPVAFGELLNIASSGLRRLPNTSLSRLPRMADFALWVTACEEALGWENGSFVADFAEARREMVSAALEAEPIVEPLRELAGGLGWEGTATELLDKLIEIAGLKEAKRPPDGWPKTPNVLSNKLRRLSSALRQEGIEVKRLSKDSKGFRFWTLTKVGENIAVTAVTAVTRENTRVSYGDYGDLTAIYGDARRSNGDPSQDTKSLIDKDSGDYGDNGDVSRPNSGGLQIEASENPQADDPEEMWDALLASAEQEAAVDEEDFPSAARLQRKADDDFEDLA